ncbi:MAG: ATP-binding protein, partial [Chitinophagaceae bacterium]
VYANEWLTQFTNQTIKSLNQTKWKNVIHPADYDSFLLLLKNDLTKPVAAVKTQFRLKNQATNEFLWHQVSLSPFKNDKDEVQYWIGYMVDIHAQKVFEETLKDNIELKQTQELLKENQGILENYIGELNRSNHELQQFAYVASHDLQEPVRKMLFYSDYLLTNYKENIDPKGTDYLNNLQSAAHRMRNLIYGILSFSQINQEKTELKEIDLNKIAGEAMQDLEIAIRDKNAIIDLGNLPIVSGDERMIRQLFQNIIGNSLKYSSPSKQTVIKISASEKGDSMQVSFSDNGIGFDEKYLPQMFTLFHRLHNRQDYEGTGMGLAICKKIMDVHKGSIRAESTEGKGSVFHISFPNYTLVS